MEYIYYPKGLEGRDYFTPKRSPSKEEFCISKNFTIPKLKYFEFFLNGKKVMAKLTLMVDLMDYLLINKRPYNKHTFIWVMLPMLRKRLWHMYIYSFLKKSYVIFHFTFLYMSKQNEHVQRHINQKRIGKNLLLLFLKRYQLCYCQTILKLSWNNTKIIICKHISTR